MAENSADLNGGDEWVEEEISAEEVERVIHQLEQLIDSVESVIIQDVLSEAYAQIEELVDWEDEDGTSQADAA